MKQTILAFCLLLAALHLQAQQLPPYQHTSQNTVLTNRAEHPLYYWLPPSGSTPVFPAYVPDSLKNGAMWQRTGSTSPGLYQYNTSCSCWVMIAGPLGDANVVHKAGTETITGDKNLTSVFTFTHNLLGASTFNHVNLINTTPATLGLVQSSPALHFGGSSYATTPGVSMPIDFRMWLKPAQQAAQSAGQLLIDASINGSAYYNIFTLGEQGGLGVPSIATHKLSLSTALNAASGYVSAYRQTNDIGPVADGDVLVGMDLNSTFSNGQAVATVNAIVGGSGYTDGFYPSVVLTDIATSQVGNSILANVTVSGGAVTTVFILTGGARHQIGNMLVANNAAIGGGTGFSCLVATNASYAHTDYQLRATNAPSKFSNIIVAPGGTYTGSEEGTIWHDGTNLWAYVHGVATQISNQTGTPSITLSYSAGTALPITISSFATTYPQFGSFPKIEATIASGGQTGLNITSQATVTWSSVTGPPGSVSINANDDTTGHLATDLKITIKQ